MVIGPMGHIGLIGPMTTGEMRGDYSFRIKKQYILSLPPARRDEKAAGSWEAPRSGGSLFSLFVSLCDLSDLERSGREIKSFLGLQLPLLPCFDEAGEVGQDAGRMRGFDNCRQEVRHVHACRFEVPGVPGYV